MSALLVVVFDSNVAIPLVLAASRSSRIVARLLAGGHEPVISAAILSEVEEKLHTKESLRKWLGVADEEIEEFLNNLSTVFTVFVTEDNVPRVVVDDPDDDLVIATAVQSKAGYIVSEDRHLLRMDGFQGIRIMTRDDFLRELDRLGVP